ncbi:period circadian protein homolog 2-like [Diretmus argenteus]
MSEDSDPKHYLYSTLDGRKRDRERVGFQMQEEDGSPCGSISQLHRMASGYNEGCGGRDRAELEPELGLTSEGSDSSHEHPASPGAPRDDRKRPRPPLHEDVEMGGCGSSGSGTESHGNESHGNESQGNESVGSSNGNGKDSALLESSESNKSSNSHSPSPPSSSNAFSLVSSEQDNPSTSGCSSEQSAKAKTQKELFKTLKELKMHLPSDKRSKGKSSTLNTLKYALRCVKQVKANEEYYQMLMINDSRPPGLDVSSYTIEEINSITSEYTLKNTDIFAVAVSLVTGKIVYISDQAAAILNCKLEVFNNAKFVEFLTPQDVSVFYSFTTPYRLPSWSMCTGAESSPTECMQEKSFFCRISGGKERGGDLQYYPFRMTPYLMKVQDTELTEEQFCCLLLAERVHSGYEAPRIPHDKRIFTTTHTPNCVFQDVDERAVPLLGYLPQDLIGTPVLLNLHPSDRPLMLAIHRKILQYAGQPFDHSSIRFCARNGEYLTIDTSWSSFVNPWSRKVSFVIGRHKVRMGPVNEDVFAVPVFHGGKIMDSDIQEISEQIHRMLLQHNMGSSGYGSHGSNGSHEQLVSVGSSSESNGNVTSGNTAEETGKAKPTRTFQEICKGVHMLKNQDSQVYLRSPSSSPWPYLSKPEHKRTADAAAAQKSPAVRLRDSVAILQAKDSTASSVEDLSCKDQTVYSYQQISCLDSVIRYLESCNIPITAKRKYQFSSNTTSSNSDDDKKDSENGMQGPKDSNTDPLMLDARPGLSSMKAPKKPPSGAAPVVGGPLTPLALPSKAESVVSITSQCSYSSTIVHVGDKKPQPESEIIEDVAESLAPPTLPVSVVSPPSQEKEAYKRMGLTKQVLAAHTQKEEQAFLRCREVRSARTFPKDCSMYLHKHSGPVIAEEPSGHRGASKLGTTRPEPTVKKGGRNRKSKKPCMKHPDSSDSAVSHRKPRPPLQGLNQTSWSPSEASQSAFNVSYPAMVPAYPLSVYPTAPAATVQDPCPDPSLSTGFGEAQSSQVPPTATPYPAPIVTPVVALVLPNYIFPQIGQMGATPRQTFFPEQTQTQPTYTTQQPFQPAQPAYSIQTQPPYANQQPFSAQPAFPPQQPFQAPQTAYATQQPFQTQPAYTPQQPFQTQPAYTTQQPFTAQPSFPVQPQFVAQAPYAAQPFPYGLATESPKAPAMEPRDGAVSRSSTPASGGQEPATSPPLFESRCSSPLQLNLLSMEEGQRSLERQDSTVLSSGAGEKNGATGKPENHQQVESRGDGAQIDGDSSSSDMLDILLQEDSHSGTGSATSGSTGSRSGSGSGSNGCGMSASGSGSRTGHSNTSKYFGSVDSLEHDTKAKAKSNTRAEGCSEGGQSQGQGSAQGEEEHFIKYVHQEPLWLLMANTDDKVMMTYQMPSRDIQKVLREDKERLRQMQKSQPCFSSDQRRELLEEHPWMRRGGLPSVINVKECVYCEDMAAATLEQDLADMGDLGEDNLNARKQSKEPQAQPDSGS